MDEMIAPSQEVLQGLSQVIITKHMSTCGEDDIGDVGPTANLGALLFVLHLGGLPMIGYGPTRLP